MHYEQNFMAAKCLDTRLARNGTKEQLEFVNETSNIGNVAQQTDREYE